MRILMISQWFDPEPTFKGLAFARELQRQGHEVEVLTGFPNYPGGKVYPGYRIRSWLREKVEGIAITRVALYPSHDRSAVRRILNYASFALSSALAALFTRRPDVVYLYHPPGTAALPALMLKWLRGVPFVLDIQDMWPDTLAATGMMGNPRVLRAIDWWMNRIYAAAAQIVVLSEGFRRLLLKRAVPPEKVTVIPNWTYEHEVPSTPNTTLADHLGFAGRFNVVFAGTMGTAQALDTVIAAAGRLAESHPQVRFVMIGGGVEREGLETLAKAQGLSNVVFLPRRPPSEIPAILGLADALLVHLKDDPLFEVTIPSKTQAYLRAGRPILMGVKGDAAQVVAEAEAGIAFAPENADALASAVCDLIALDRDTRERMGEAGRLFYDSRFSLKTGGSAWGRLLERVAGTMRSARS